MTRGEAGYGRAEAGDKAPRSQRPNGPRTPRPRHRGLRRGDRGAAPAEEFGSPYRLIPPGRNGATPRAGRGVSETRRDRRDRAPTAETTADPINDESSQSQRPITRPSLIPRGFLECRSRRRPRRRTRPHFRRTSRTLGHSTESRFLKSTRSRATRPLGATPTDTRPPPTVLDTSRRFRCGDKPHNVAEPRRGSIARSDRPGRRCFPRANRAEVPYRTAAAAPLRPSRLRLPSPHANS